MGRLSSKNKLEIEISAGESRINKEKLKSDKIKGLTSLYETIIGKINDQIIMPNNNQDAVGLFLFDSHNQKNIYDGTDRSINGDCIQTDREMPKIFTSSDARYPNESIMKTNEETVNKLTLNSIFAKNTTVAIASNKAKLSSAPFSRPQTIGQALQGFLIEPTESNQEHDINGDDIFVAEELVIYCETPQSLDSNDSAWLDSLDSNNSPWMYSTEEKSDSLDSNDSSWLTLTEANFDPVDLEIERFLKNVESSLHLNDPSHFMGSTEQNFDFSEFQNDDSWTSCSPNTYILDFNNNLYTMIEDSKESDYQIPEDVYNSVFKPFETI